MEYEITDDGNFSYNPIRDIIELSSSNIMLNGLSDDELIEYISDVIVHEHLHKIVRILVTERFGGYLGYIVTCLFDSVGYFFRESPELDAITTDTSIQLSWRDAIKSRGIDCLFNFYKINRKTYIKKMLPILLLEKEEVY